MEMLDELDRANLSQPSPDAEDDDAEEEDPPEIAEAVDPG